MKGSGAGSNYTGVNIHRIDMDEDDHEIPEHAGSDKHDDSVNCWCEPDLKFVDARDGRRIWQHKAPK